MKKQLPLFMLLAALCFGAKAQETKIRFFGQPGFEFNTNPSQGTSSPYFRGGPLVLFATSQLGERFSVAGELHAHYMHNTGAEVELERMYLKYYWKDFMSFRIGRMYTPIGFWNLNYNFGLVLQPNIGRPRMLQPTHDGGFIPTRESGLQIEGENITKARIFYKVLVGNGIGKNGGYLGTPYNLGNTLSYTAQLGFEPADGLKFSVSGMLNQMEQGRLNQFGDSLTEDITNTLLSGSLSFMNPEKKFEFVSEYFLSTNQYSSIGSKSLHGAFLYAGFKVSDKVVPYIYAELLSFDSSDPYYNRINEYTSQIYSSSQEYNLGIRYKANANVVLKLEASSLYQELYGWSFGPKTQVAFGF